jgi:hypothetical protein
MSFAVRKIDEPITPPTSNNTESSKVRPRTSVGPDSAWITEVGEVVASPMDQPIPNSSADSRGVPQRRQMTAEQSPQVKGSETSTAHFGQ